MILGAHPRVFSQGPRSTKTSSGKHQDDRWISPQFWLPAYLASQQGGEWLTKPSTQIFPFHIGTLKRKERALFPPFLGKFLSKGEVHPLQNTVGEGHLTFHWAPRKDVYYTASSILVCPAWKEDELCEIFCWTSQQLPEKALKGKSSHCLAMKRYYYSPLNITLLFHFSNVFYYYFGLALRWDSTWWAICITHPVS